MTDERGVAAARSALGRLAGEEKLTAAGLFGAIGGVRGVVESMAPGLLFLIVFTVTGALIPSIVAPVVVAVVVLLARLIQRKPVMPAVSGGIGIVLSAGLALWTGRAQDNFVGGFIANGLFLLVVLVTLVIRKPLVGLVVNLFDHDETDRTARSVIRAEYIATWVWAVLFSLRLVVEVPLWLASATAALAATKLLLGLPAYAAALWISWLVIRSALPSAAKGPTAQR